MGAEDQDVAVSLEDVVLDAELNVEEEDVSDEEEESHLAIEDVESPEEEMLHPLPDFAEDNAEEAEEEDVLEEDVSEEEEESHLATEDVESPEEERLHPLPDSALSS